MNVAVLVSGGGTNLQSLIDGIRVGLLKRVRITRVIASRPGIHALERAALAGIPTAVVRRKEFTDMAGYDAAMMRELTDAGAELIVLAGFLSLLGPEVVNTFRNRILNIHPALLPAFGGKGMYGIHVHEAVLAKGVKWSGATVHLINEDYDEGPILLQKPVEVLQGDTPETLQKRIMDEAEHELLCRAVQLMEEGRVLVADGRTTILPPLEHENPTGIEEEESNA